MDAGANVNSLNYKGQTPLMIAGYEGSHNVLRLLVATSKIQVDLQVRKVLILNISS